MIPTVSGQGEDISVSVTSGLVRNTVYSVRIVSININGENPSMGDIQFSKSSQSMIIIAKYIHIIMSIIFSVVNVTSV